MFRVVIDVGHGQHGEILVEILDQGIGNHGQLDGAGLHQLQRRALIPEQLIGVNFQLVLAASGGFQLLAEVLQRLELGIVLGLIERRLQDHGTSSLAVFTTSSQKQTSDDHCANQRQLGQRIHCTHVSPLYGFGYFDDAHATRIRRLFSDQTQVNEMAFRICGNQKSNFMKAVCCTVPMAMK
ncbi:hypothetical protein D3C86_1513270 [compost metagenome]